MADRGEPTRTDRRSPCPPPDVPPSLPEQPAASAPASRTGAARGIGPGVAKRLAADGLAVAVLDLDEAGCKLVEEEMTAATAARMGITFEDFKARAAAQIPVARTGTPADIAHAVSFFVSEDAGFVSGQVIYVAGGPKA